MGPCGGLDCFSPLAPSPVPISSIPSGLWGLIPSLGGLGVGQSLGPAPGQSLWGWIPAGVTHLQPGAPCTSCPGCLPHPDSRDSHCPPWHWDVLWLLLLPTGTGQCPGTASHSSWGAGGSPFAPSPAPRAAPVGRDPPRAAGAVHSSESRAAPAPPSPPIHREGVGAAGAGAVQCQQQPGLAAPEAADVKIKGRSCPGSVWERLPHSALWLWFIRRGVLAQPP